MTGTALVAHSGGPTPVINASLLGVAEAMRGKRLLGARHGIDGALREDFIELTPERVAAVARAPSSALGTSRREVTEEDLGRLIAVFRARDIRYFFYAGGNGSMGTAHQLSQMASGCGYELHVVGIPKTIDNDLCETDHTPGFGSAARFFACAARDIGADNWALPGQVEILEVLGRNSGWLAAATSLARGHGENRDAAPHLIYYPENRLPLDRLLGDIDGVYGRLGRCVVIVCEGQLDESGKAFGADTRRGSRGALAMNLGHRLSLLVTERLGLRARSEKPGLLGRSSAAFISETDWRESRLCGEQAVRAAEAGQSGIMVTLQRSQDEAYGAVTGSVALDRVAFVERGLPPEWRSQDAGSPPPGFRGYAEPLTGPIAEHARIE